MEASTAGPSNDVLLAEAGVEIPAAATAPVVAPVFTPAKPDITKAQLVGSIPVVAKLLSAFGVYTLTGAQQEALTIAAGSGVALYLADAVIRFGRSRAFGKQ